MEAVCVLLVVGIVASFVWQYIETRGAEATTTVDTSYDPGQAAQIIETAFSGARSVLWTDASGPGTLNKRRRGVRSGITMSIGIEPLPDGGSHVAMWASETVIYLGFLVNFAGVVNRRKRAIIRLLSDATPLTPGRP
jgi:hypothetical protein